MSVVFSNNSQEEQLRKEELQIVRRKKIADERLERILNPRSKYGAETRDLDAQTAESRRRKEIEQQNREIDRLRALQVETILEQNAEEDRKMKFQQMQQLKDAWESNLRQKQKDELKYKQDKLNVESTSLTSTVLLAGEDLDAKNRIEKQREQMRQWINEQLSEQNNKKQQDKNYEDKYNEMQRMLYEIRTQDEKDEEEYRRNARLQLLRDNEQLAKERQFYRESTDDNRNMSYEEKLKALSLDLFNEDRSIAMGGDNRVTRVDMFKGFTNEQKQRYMQENQEIARSKREMQEMERQREIDWAKQQAMLHHILESNNEEEERYRREVKLQDSEYIKQQAQEQALRHQQMRQDKFGNIEMDNGYYSRFGKSHR